MPAIASDLHRMKDLMDDIRRLSLHRSESSSSRVSLESPKNPLKPQACLVDSSDILNSCTYIGILSLPMEVLIHIFGILCSESENRFRRGTEDTLIKQLSSVSKMFRDSVLCTVNLWTRIDEDYCLREGLEARISRTKNAPLALHFAPVDYPAWVRLQALTLPLKERWQHIWFDFMHSDPDVLKKLPRMEFPRLVSARLQFKAQSHCDSFFTHWTFPNMESLTIENAVPRPTGFRELKSFKFTADLSIEDEDADTCYARLVEFLRHSSRLQDLSLDLTNIYPELDSEPPLELPSLVTLSISDYPFDFTNAYQNLFCMLESLKIPNVKHFHIRILFENELHDWKEPSSSVKQALRAVSSLSVVTSFQLVQTRMQSLCATFPNVQHLELQAPGIASTLKLLEVDVNFSRLRSLTLNRSVEGATEDWRKGLCKMTQNVGNLDITFNDYEMSDEDDEGDEDDDYDDDSDLSDIFGYDEDDDDLPNPFRYSSYDSDSSQVSWD